MPKEKTEWSKWQIFFCDERHVPFDSPDCTFSQYKSQLVDKVRIPVDHVYPIDPTLSGMYRFVIKLFSIEEMNMLLQVRRSLRERERDRERQRQRERHRQRQAETDRRTARQTRQPDRKGGGERERERD